MNNTQRPVIQRPGRITRAQAIMLAFAILIVLALIFYPRTTEAEDQQSAVAEATEQSVMDRIGNFFGETKAKAETKIDETIEDAKVSMGLKVSKEDAAKMQAEFNDQSSAVFENLLVQAAADHGQMDCMIRALVFEAGGEPTLGKLWVLHVIKNRVDLDYRGKSTECEVIFDHKQFSFANLNPDRVPKYSADLIKSVQLVTQFYSQYQGDITDCATHYVVSDIIDDVDWAKAAIEGKSPKNEPLELKAIIGHHTFFGPPGATCAEVRG